MGVHYSEQNALPGALEAVRTTRTDTGSGLDEGACAAFEDGRFSRALGRPVDEITMSDFESGAHTVQMRT